MSTIVQTDHETTRTTPACHQVVERKKARAVNDREAAAYIGMSVSFLRKSRMEGDRQNRTPGPPFLKIGRSVRYLTDVLDMWLEQNRGGARS